MPVVAGAATAIRIVVSDILTWETRFELKG